MEIQAQANKEQDGNAITDTKQQLLGCAKSVCFGAALLVCVITVAGAIDLYGALTIDLFKQTVTLEWTSIWPPSILGIVSEGFMAWSICGICKLYSGEAKTVNGRLVGVLLAVLAISFLLWLLCLSTADALIDYKWIPALSGFTLWAYYSLHIPHAALVMLIIALVGWGISRTPD